MWCFVYMCHCGNVSWFFFLLTGTKNDFKIWIGTGCEFSDHPGSPSGKTEQKSAQAKLTYDQRFL